MKFIIRGRLISLNDYTKVSRGNAYASNKLKREQQQLIGYAIKQAKLEPVKKYPVEPKITWYEKDSRRDADNIVFAKKFILDALVNHRIIIDDSRKYVSGFEEKVLVDKHNPRIEVEIIEG